MSYNKQLSDQIFCLGTDDFHTSEELVPTVEKELESLGY